MTENIVVNSNNCFSISHQMTCGFMVIQKRGIGKNFLFLIKKIFLLNQNENSMFCFKLKEKIVFYWRAKSSHGLHSPFVYSLYTSISKNAKSIKLQNDNFGFFSKKQTRILIALFQFLKPNKVLIINNTDQVWAKYLSKNCQIKYCNQITELAKESKKFDLIILSNNLLISDKEIISQLPLIISNNSVVIIPHVHASKQSIKQWNNLIKEEMFSLSLDLFFVGVLFFRKESTKQDFQLRF